MGLPGGLSILALDGGSTVEVNNLYLGGHFSFTAGEGADQLLCGLDSIVSPERFFASTGGGADVVDCLNTYVEFDGRIDTGDGDDVVRLFDQLAAPGQFTLSYSSGQGSGIVTGEGNDFVLARYAFVVGNFGIVGEGGNDYMQVYGSAFNGQLSLFGSSGHDACLADTNYAPFGLNIYGDDGADYLLAANNIHGQGDVFIDGDLGGDFIEVRNISADQLSIAGDAGNDAVEVKYSLLQLLYGDLGDGDDLLTLTSNTITGSLFLDGGNGVDRLRDLGGSYPAASSRVRWELF
jgi:hypothetical protein